MVTDGQDYESYGQWLNEQRARRGLSIRELAELSGVALAQIYNIENGKTRNPQARTRERFSRALGDVPVPAGVLATTEEQANIAGLGSLVDFDPHSHEERPEEPGVYVLYDRSDRPLYVGQSKNIRQRLRSHEEKFWFRSPIVETASYLRIDDDDLRRQVEQVLIKFLRSNAVINKQHVSHG